MFPTTPEPFTAAPDQAEVIDARMSEFFAAILEYLGYDAKAKQAFVEVVANILHRYGTSGQVMPTDDRATMLIVKNVTVAMVLERRNDGNSIEVRFNNYLNPEIVEQVSLQERRCKPGSSMIDDIHVDMRDCANPDHIRDLRAARAMAASADLMVSLGQLDPRSFLSDARLLYGEEPGTWDEEKARKIVELYIRNR